MIALLVLFPALIFGAEFDVNWVNCKTEKEQYNCFCEDAGTIGQLKLQKSADEETTINKNCKSFGVQIKSITENIVIFYLQYKEAPSLGTAPELFLEHGQLIFGCKFEPGGATTLLADDNLKNKFGISMFEKRSQRELENLLCAIQVDKAHPFYAAIPTAEITSLKLKGQTEIEHKIGAEGNSLFAPPKSYKCNPFLFKKISQSNTYYIKQVMNRDQPELTCNYGDLFTMGYKKDEEKEERKITKLECKGTEDSGYFYHIVEEDDTPGKRIVNQESYAIFCGADFKKMCKSPRKCETSTECPDHKAGTVSEDATYTCPGKKWIIGGEYLTLTEDPKCLRDAIENPEDAGFFAKLPAGNEEAITTDAKCFTNFDCQKKSKLILPECKGKADCGVVDISNGKLTCADPNRTLKKGNETVDGSFLKCNTTDGTWTDAKLASIPPGTKISCFEAKKNASAVVVKEADLTDVQVYCIIGGVFLTIVAVLAACFFGILFYFRRRNKVAVKDKKAWKKLNKSEKVEHCSNLFGAIESEKLTVEKLLGMLNMMDTMLDTETYHIECWDSVQIFLLRFQGAMLKTDFPIWHMLSRYCYLRAKKIIDKHGWLSPKPITNKDEVGLMRCVAIQLLSFAISDPLNSEAEEMVQDGFTQLGFDAVAQYPHCGKMWSVILHARPLSTHFDPMVMIEYLDAIASELKITMPKEDVHVDVGSIARQAAYALGSAPNHNYIIVNAQRILLKLDHDDRKVVSKYFFVGICQSITRNPSQCIMEACSQWPYFNQKFFDKIYTVAPQSEWNEIVRKTAYHTTYYGHFVDAMRLGSRFQHNDKEFERTLAEMKVDQETFEKVLDSVKEDVRAWFAKRTDKEELKKAPEYIREVKGVKLDDRILAGDKTPTNVLGGTQSNSKSGSSTASSKSSEGSSNAPSPAAETPPAAPAAAAAATPNAADAAAPAAPAAAPAAAAAAPAS